MEQIHKQREYIESILRHKYDTLIPSMVNKHVSQQMEEVLAKLLQQTHDDKVAATELISESVKSIEPRLLLFLQDQKRQEDEEWKKTTGSIGISSTPSSSPPSSSAGNSVAARPQRRRPQQKQKQSPFPQQTPQQSPQQTPQQTPTNVSATAADVSATAADVSATAADVSATAAAVNASDGSGADGESLEELLKIIASRKFLESVGPMEIPKQLLELLLDDPPVELLPPPPQSSSTQQLSSAVNNVERSLSIDLDL